MNDQNQPNHSSDELTQSFWQAWREQQGSTQRLAHLLLQRGRYLLDRFQHFHLALNKLSRPAQQRWQRKLGASLAGVALTLALSSAPAQAAAITVDGMICTLVDAITAANTDAVTGGCAAGSGADTITLSGNVTLTTINNSTSYGNNGLPVITSQITIEGNSFTIARASASLFRILPVAASGNLTLNATTISGGSTSDTGGGGIMIDHGTLTVSNSTLSGNTSTFGQGGGIHNRGTATVSNSTVSGNSASSGGGISNSFGSTLTLSNSTVSSNSGGGVLNNEMATLSNSTVSGNTGRAGVAIGTVIENKNIEVASFTQGGSSFGLSGYAVGTTVEAAGTLVAVYKDSNGAPFDVAVDGFKFENFSNDAPRNFSDDLGADDLFGLFGPVACQSGTTAATCVLSGPAQKWKEDQIAGMNGGHCEGMAATSLRLFNWLPFKSKSSPASFQAGAATTINLNFPEQSIENYIAHYFVTQSVAEYGADEITAAPVVLVNKLIADFNAATPIPYTVGIYALPGWEHGHAITAYGVETVNANQSRILVYDNNFPKQRRYITVNMAANTWRYVTSSTPGETPTIYSGTATSGNLSLHTNNARDLPAGQYFTCTFCNQPASNASVQAAAASMVAGEISLQYSGEGAILVINDEGQKTGTDIGNDTLLEEIPGAELTDFKGGLGKAIPPRITVPFTEIDETFYTVVVHGTTVTSPTHGSLSIVGPGFHMGVDKVELDPNEVLTFTVSPDGDHITFVASKTEKAPTIHIAHDPIHDGSPSVIFDVADEILFAGEKIALNLDPALERIEFNDTGLEEEGFTVTMNLIFPDGDVHVYTETLIVPAGATSALIDFGAWDGRLIPPTYIDHVLQNPSVNHRLKLASSTGVYDRTPQANAPAGVYHVEATFTNVTEVSLEKAYFTLANLGAGNVVLNADGGPAGVGAKIAVPAAALGADGILHTNESFTFRFDVGLASAGASGLTVDANGVPHDWIHPNPPPAYDANNASFVFALNASRSIFLPLIAR